MTDTDRIEKRVVLRARRAEAYRMNDQGWTEQTKNIERHVSAP